MAILLSFIAFNSPEFHSLGSKKGRATTNDARDQSARAAVTPMVWPRCNLNRLTRRLCRHRPYRDRRNAIQGLIPRFPPSPPISSPRAPDAPRTHAGRTLTAAFTLLPTTIRDGHRTCYENFPCEKTESQQAGGTIGAAFSTNFPVAATKCAITARSWGSNVAGPPGFRRPELNPGGPSYDDIHQITLLTGTNTQWLSGDPRKPRLRKPNHPRMP